MRLIDADALKEKAVHYSETEYHFDHYAVEVDDIDDAPTIEPASLWHRVEDIADKTNKGPIVPFSARMWVEREFIKWCEENNVAKVGNALVVFMLNHDWINRDKLVKDYRNRDKEGA